MSTYYFTVCYQSENGGINVANHTNSNIAGELPTFEELNDVKRCIAETVNFKKDPLTGITILSFNRIKSSDSERTNLDKLLETHRELIIDCLSASDTHIAVSPNGEVVSCDDYVDCKDCIFYDSPDQCADATRKWLQECCKD